MPPLNRGGSDNHAGGHHHQEAGFTAQASLRKVASTIDDVTILASPQRVVDQLEGVAVDTLSARKAPGKEWVVDLFRAIDSMDAKTFAEVFTEEGTFRFCNSEPVAGTQQVQQSVSEFFSLIGGLSHNIAGVWSGVWEKGEVKSVEAEVTFTRRDGSRTQPLPVTSTLRMEEGRISDYTVFMDISPVFAEHASTAPS